MPIARIILQYGHASPISAADWTPDGRFLVTGSTDGQLLVWDLAGHIVGQATLGSPDDRAVVERIKVAADGQSVAIDELYFEDMWDNGVASEIHRRSYLYRFGDAAATGTVRTDLQPGWKDGTPFLSGTRDMKNALFARTDWPRSRLGWTLARVDGVLAMRSPDATVKLSGALGAGSDEGDRRLENRALAFEQRWAVVQAQIDNPGKAPPPPPPKPIDRSSAPVFSPDGATLAWIERDDASASVHLLDLAGGAARPQVRLPGGAAPMALAWGGPTTLTVTRDGGAPVAIDAKKSSVMTAAGMTQVASTTVAACSTARPPMCLNDKGAVEVTDPGSGNLICTAIVDEGDPIPAALAVMSADRSTIALQTASGYTALFDVRSPTSAGGKCKERAAFRGTPGRIGFHPTAPLFWTEARGGALVFTPIDRVGAEQIALFTLYRLPGDHFFVRDAVGRYDTNLGPDSEAVRWQVSDAPFQSFPAQTFMRDYFEPRLIARLTDCTMAGTCGTVFPAVPPIAALNRVLPKVSIISVKSGADPATALVTVRVADGVDPLAANGKTRSGAYDVRLFLNNRLIAQRPEQGLPADLTAWRTQYRLPDASAANGMEISFTVPLATAPGTEAMDFSAYAFNEDRVKSDTAHAAYRRGAVSTVPPRAFVVTIGIDAYDDPRLKLNFSANDATLIADRLAAIPGYEVRRLMLAGSAGKRVTRADIVALLRGLSSGPDAVRPDDIVIISFSGHGWADAAGNFFLFPAEASWPTGAAAPDTATLISSGDLAQLLVPVRAAEITVVIDACHSAASVAASGFKPGPMGDAGLGQLAFDKGIRILAASQADDVALESATLRQGLLTFALAAEGIDATGGRADLNRDGRITIDEWLHYGADRLPALSEDVKLGNAIANARGFKVVRDPSYRPQPQQPALFDFTGRPSPVVLRRMPAK
ncbi:MAG: caspase family protein [Sphingomonas sp.]